MMYNYMGDRNDLNVYRKMAPLVLMNHCLVITYPVTPRKILFHKMFHRWVVIHFLFLNEGI